MQTFLPDPDFARSAAVLDDRRLGKQRVEVLQILRAAHLDDYGWSRHPAVLMWRGHPLALVAYGLAVVEEWRGRGRPDRTLPHITEFAHPRTAVGQAGLAPAALPPWLGSAPLHRSHRSALVRKDPAHYRPLFPDVPDDLPYVWPPLDDPPPTTPPPFSAWVVRAQSEAALERFRSRGEVTLDPGFGAAGAAPKRRRQAARFVAMRPGEPVAVPAGATLLVGTLHGDPPGEAPSPAGPRRAVRWRATVPRAALRRPFQLQDPQVVFALRGEPAVQV